jgi:hypothetical protein
LLFGVQLHLELAAHRALEELLVPVAQKLEQLPLEAEVVPAERPLVVVQ